MSKLFPVKVGDLVQVTPQHGDYSRTVIVEEILPNGRIGVFMPCFGGGAYRKPSLCYYNDEQYVVLAENWKEDLDKARQERIDEKLVKPGDFVRIKNRQKQFVASGFWPGSVYRVTDTCDNGVEVNIEGEKWYFRHEEYEKVSLNERFENEG